MKDIILQFIDKHMFLSVLILCIVCMMLCWVVLIIDTLLHMLFGGTGRVDEIMSCIDKVDVPDYDYGKDFYAEMLLFGFVLVMYPGLIVSANMIDKWRKEDAMYEDSKANKV